MQSLIQFLASYVATIILLAIYAVILATATFVEQYFGPEVGTIIAKKWIYYSPGLIFLQFLLVVNFVLILIKRHYIQRKKWAFVVIHVAFVVILAGAMTTFLFGSEGQVHIREGEKTNQKIIHSSRGVSVHELPFYLELVEFRALRFPGTATPKAYEADLRIHIEGEEVRDFKIFMNNVLDLKGYRFFQAGYDEDERGTFLSVNNDVAGRLITYSGYTLLIIGFIMMFFVRTSRYRQLWDELRELRKTAKVASVGALFFLLSTSVFGHAMPPQTMSQQAIMDVVQQICPEHAARFGALPIQFQGRTMPMNTFSSKALRKVHRDTRFENLNSDQFLLSLFAMPQMWKQVPLISVSRELSRHYNLPERHSPFLSFFTPRGDNILYDEVERIQQKSATTRTAYERELLQLNERIAVFWLLAHHKIPDIFPNPASPLHTWYAPGDSLLNFRTEDSLFIKNTFTWYLNEVQHAVRSGSWSTADNVLNVIKAHQLATCTGNLIQPNRIQAEIRYNRLDFFNRSRPFYFMLGGLLLIIAFLRLIRERKWLRYASLVLTVGIVFVFLFHAFGMGMRWFVSGHAPWSNSYESMVYVAWISVLVGFIFGRKNDMMVALGTLFGGVILFVASLNWMNPQITTLVPVLRSPWLIYHVATNVAAYGFFGISFLLGVINMGILAFAKNSSLAQERFRELTIINNMSLLIGLALMTIGAFIGGVWANESWGRYWGWDPKETWALITIVIYTIVTHLYLIKQWYNDWLLNLLSSLAFSSVLMTYFGVNYFLSGLHSYGNTAGNIHLIMTYIGLAFLAIAVLGVISYRNRNVGKKQKNLISE